MLTSFSQYDAPLKLPYSNSNILAILVTGNAATTERYLGITAQELDNAYDALCENKEINSYNEDFVQNEKWTQNGL